MMEGRLSRRLIRFFRDDRVLRIAGQSAFVLAAAVFVAWLVGNLNDALDARGLTLSFSFLQRTAGFAITQGPGMARTESFWRAYQVGVLNSLNVVLAGLVLTTLIGLLAGVALLSPNWLLRNTVRVYVEVMRNTPLLVQLFFIYFGVVLTLPSLQDRIELGPLILSQRGVWVPRPVPQPGFAVWAMLSAVAVVVAGLISPPPPAKTSAYRGGDAACALGGRGPHRGSAGGMAGAPARTADAGEPHPRRASHGRRLAPGPGVLRPACGPGPVHRRFHRRYRARRHPGCAPWP